MRRGTRSVNVKKPNFSEAVQDATIREGAGELTLQTDEVGTLRAFMNTQTTLSVRGGDRRMLMRTMQNFCQAIYKGKEWERMGRCVLSLQRVEPGGRGYNAE